MSETPSNETLSERWKVSETVLLAAFPVYGFYLAYRYESGIADYYGYTNSFIIVSIENIFIATGALLSIAAVLFIILNALYTFIPEEKQKYLIYFLPLIYIALFYIGYLSTKKPNLSESLIVAALLFSIPSIYYIPPIFSIRKYGGYLNSLIALEKQEEEFKRRTIVAKISMKIGMKKYLMLIVLLFMMPLFSNNLGYRDAKNKPSYLVFNTGKEFVVLKIYGQNMIYAPLNRKEHQFSNEFFLRPLTPNLGTSFRLEKIGPISPQK